MQSLEIETLLLSLSCEGIWRVSLLSVPRWLSTVGEIFVSALGEVHEMVAAHAGLPPNRWNTNSNLLPLSPRVTEYTA